MFVVAFLAEIGPEKRLLTADGEIHRSDKDLGVGIDPAEGRNLLKLEGENESSCSPLDTFGDCDREN